MVQPQAPMGSDLPIGVFDSGVGGLSVLRHMRALLPSEDLLYFADSGFAPYGDKPESVIVERSIAIAEYLLEHGIKALAIPCNTATAAAGKVLRERYPSLPLVGVEPGLKPAAALTRSGIVGVLATKGTLASAKFHLLQEQLTASTGVRFLPQACIGLADQIEKGETHSAQTALLIRRYVTPLIEAGADTLVLGCTHYPFAQPLIQEIAGQAAGRPVAIVDTGEAVARQLQRLLEQHGLRRGQEAGQGTVKAWTSGSRTALETAFSRLMNMAPPVMAVAASPAS